MAENAEHVHYEEEFIINGRGLKLFTCWWLPKNQGPKALVFLCHGYAVGCNLAMNGTAITLAEAGMAVYGIDYEGHGKSSGLRGYIPNFENIVSDCCDFFTSIAGKQRKEEGEQDQNEVSVRGVYGWCSGPSGAVLVAPMCKIADEIKPSPLLISILNKLCMIIPTWKIIPTKDIIDISIKDPKRREEVRSNPYCYKGNPRLKTGNELLRISTEIEKSLHEVTFPFLLVHGEEDRVTDPSVSKLLFESASSTDKTLKLYPGMWHALTSGESPENIELVFSDIIIWLDKHVSQGNMRVETECKAEQEGEVPACLAQG